MEELSIGEVARRADLSVSAVRYYESLGLLSARRANGHRRFDPSVLERLDFIRVAQHVGFDLTQIGALIRSFETGDSPAALCQGIARQRVEEIDRLAAELARIRHALAESLQCTCTTLTQCAYTLNPAGAVCADKGRGTRGRRAARLGATRRSD